MRTLEDVLDAQLPDGLFPTFGGPEHKEIEERPETIVRNIGIHTFILEELMETFPDNDDVQEAVARGVDALLREAVNTEYGTAWGWLKKPRHGKDVMPPDIDDTARGHLVTMMAKKKGLIDVCPEYDFRTALLGILTPFGAYTFMGPKNNNAVCPVVNANVLQAYKMYLAERTQSNLLHDGVFLTLADYLEGVTGTCAFLDREPQRFSRYYTSHMIFTHSLSKSRDVLSGTALDRPSLRYTSITDRNTIERLMRRAEFESVDYAHALDAALGTLTLLRTGGSGVGIERGVDKIRSSEWKADPLYRWPGMGTHYGSSALTGVLCLSALKEAEGTA